TGARARATARNAHAPDLEGRGRLIRSPSHEESPIQTCGSSRHRRQPGRATRTDRTRASIRSPAMGLLVLVRR
ncbi:hypothetical protein ABTH30_21590, partial [Acinetobacter baumannii]